ncbi:MAG: (d)CMP kinase [Tepidisphaeraceae bacterium]
MIITIDGPAASGKSAVAQELARRMGSPWACLNTGSMYRAIALLALKAGVMSSESDVVQIAHRHAIDFDWTTSPPTLLIDGQPVRRDALEEREVAMAASAVARWQAVRTILVSQQRRIGREKRQIISEGRDQGSVVFEEAPFKFYLTALVTVRATRRFVQNLRDWQLADSHHRPRRPEYMDTLFDLIKRDHQDSTSKYGRLVVPSDAIIIDSTDIDGVEKVVELMMDTIQEGMQTRDH